MNTVKIKNFMHDIGEVQTFWGVSAIMRKHFSLVKTDKIDHLCVAVDLEETAYITLRRVHTCNGTTWSCTYNAGDNTVCLWKLKKSTGAQYYGKPQIFVSDLAVLAMTKKEVF